MPRRWSREATAESPDDVARQLLAVVDTFVGSRRRDRLPSTLVRLAMEQDGVDGAAVFEVSEDDVLEIVAFSDEDARELTDLQISGRGGPALDAARTGRPALLEHQGRDPRWAVLAPLADDLGLRYAYAIPLSRRRRTLGGLVVYGRDVQGVHRLGGHLEVLADVAAVGLLQARKVRAANEQAEQLERALTTRAVIEQAKGVLMAQGRCDAEAAFQMLRGHARKHRMKLDEVAREVVNSASQPNPSLVLPRQRGDEDEDATAEDGPPSPSRRKRR